MTVVGWDIGGVNTKVALAVAGALRAALQRPYEVQRAPERLTALLRELAAAIGAPAGAVHAVTMTAELSQMFRTKREGVSYVLDAITAAFPQAAIDVFGVDGRFHSVAAARTQPLLVAAANWAATAALVATRHPDVVLIDVGSTTTDIIPIAGGRVVAVGRTDPERLASGELVYSGAVRTAAEAMATHVPLFSGTAGVSAEAFALSGDVHVWRGCLAPADYCAPTPDGRPATREFAAERLARVVCADREMVNDDAIGAIARHLAEAQVHRVAVALRRVSARHPSLRTVVATGLGSFIALDAARAAGLSALTLEAELGEDASRCAPAAAVALLRASDADVASRSSPAAGAAPGGDRAENLMPGRSIADLVVKVGGGLLAQPGALAQLAVDLPALLRGRRAVIVPGGGPFADAVRDLDSRLALSDDEAHWLAIRAMDLLGELLSSRIGGSELVTSRRDVERALAAGALTVLAPYHWLREADPLPHAWSVTSDSLAAWVAGALGASELVVIKPAGAAGESLVDASFWRVLPSSVSASIVPADELARFAAARL